MTTRDLLDHCASAGVVITLDDGDLLLDGRRPPQAILDALTANKAAVVDALALARRLAHGWDVCEAAPDPATRARLEDFWIGLLTAYTEACDRHVQEMTP